MNSKYQPQLVEEKIYKEWEEKGYFKASINKNKKPFSIILPPPNANANLHLGHAMYVYEDIMIRYKKLSGFETLWLPGADHAGFETQFVFEKHLKKEGKSRFDFDRETLYKNILNFVMDNRSNMENQLRSLGFALDWSKKKFTIDKDIVKIVYDTFKKLYDDGLIYREKRLVNYCTFCGTSFSDLEVIYKERVAPLYYMKYGPFTLATTRPETKFGDTAVAVNPKDKRYQKWIGKEVEVEGLNGKFKLKVVGDDSVDPKFGTGVVKVTPAHDFTDFETGQRHKLELKQIIGFDGKLNELTGSYKGLYVNEARKKIVEDLKTKGLLVKIKEDYKHRVGTCYKCGRVLEPLPKEQWFVKIRPLADKAKKLVEKDEIKIIPKKFKKNLVWWLDNFRDWNISRQIVWGIRIPAYRCKAKREWFISVEKPIKCQICDSCKFEQDTDTFDTWFSSAQWPYATLLTQRDSDFFDYFYPTSVMETGYDILPWWVVRMIMIGVFATGKKPFKTVFLHGLVCDIHGKKMSKSKGNVVNPLDMINKYGADALRTALIFGVKEGNDMLFSEQKVVGMRNFINKMWNIGRFIHLNIKDQKSKIKNTYQKSKILENLEKEFKKEKKGYLKHMDSYQFSKALGLVYEFIWHRFADFYIEQLKDEIINGNIEALGELKSVYLENLKMLHPFIPFVTETVWKVFNSESILLEKL
ncbi:valine--tRNA ligase [Candidatus Roizmanbacteria bacterium]|nr:valine--tRNA ligase [Candidatus Roizmanbacteria bacterium]